jgi:hypothetical protein
MLARQLYYIVVCMNWLEYKYKTTATLVILGTKLNVKPQNQTEQNSLILFHCKEGRRMQDPYFSIR